MDTSSRHAERHGSRSPSLCYTQGTQSPPAYCPALIEDFEVSYIRTVIEDGPLQLPHTPEAKVAHDDYFITEDEFSEVEELDGATVPESEDEPHMKITLASANGIQDSDESRNLKPSIVDDSYWDEHDPTKKWHFEAKAYSRVVGGKEHFYCQICEDDGKVHHSFKRREMERHLRKMDHLPPELFCKSAKAVCPCPKNRAFTRIDGRKRHIKMSIEYAQRDAQSRKAYKEVEKWQNHMKLLETSRGR